jgi:hypothetical protein
MLALDLEPALTEKAGLNEQTGASTTAGQN